MSGLQADKDSHYEQNGDNYNNNHDCEVLIAEVVGDADENEGGDNYDIDDGGKCGIFPVHYYIIFTAVTINGVDNGRTLALLPPLKSGL